MIITPLLTILCIVLLGQLMHLKLTNLHKIQQIQLIREELQKYEIRSVNFTVIKEDNHNLLEFYNNLGQSIVSLNIQLQIAQKLWKINPLQAHNSIVQAYDLSGNIMQDIRQIFRNIDES